MEWRNLYSRELGLPTKCRGGDLPEFLARKLEISTVLNGHTGCVNRLAWNQDGSLLASASDDCQVLLWHYPDTSRVPIALETEHRANLFGVAILPFSNNCKIVSGAMDYTVQLHELGEGAFNITPKYRSSLNGTRGSSGNGAPPPMRRHPPSPQVHAVKPLTTIYHCHKSRVKEVEVCLAEPSLFWSAGEDGVVRQYDARTPDQKAYGSANVLVNLMTAGPSGGLVECKGLSLNQQSPNLMGVACGDPYVRLFDRRKLSTCRPGGGPTPALLQLTAPHLPLELAAGMIRRCHATHCSFSHKGDRLVASYHGDHAYVFDVTGATGQRIQQLSPQQQQRQQHQRVRRRLQQDHAPAGLSPSASPKQQQQQPRSPSQQQQQQQGQPVSQAGASSSSNSMPEAADAARVLGNNALFEQSYTAAIGHFTAAIAAAPQAAGLYTQRALALLKRGWEGDASFALRDCETAITLVLQQQQQQRGSSSSSLSGHRDSSSGGSSSNGGGNGSRSVEQQARLRLVHALKQLGQVKCALAALDSYKELYPAPASSSDVATLEKFLQEHLQRRLAYKRKLAASTARLRRTRQETPAPAAAGTGFAARRQQQQAQEQQQQQQQQVAGASIPPPPPAPPAQQQQGPDVQQQQQQEEEEQQQPSAVAMLRSLSSGGSSSGGSSRSASPLGGRPHDPPGRGIRVDTDVDSEDLERDLEDLERDTDMQTTSAAAAAGSSEDMSAAAASGSGQGFIGPVLPEGFSTATAAAAAATQPPPPPPPPAAAAAAPEGMAVESGSDSAGDESSPGSDPMSEGEDDSPAGALSNSPQPLLVDPELPAEPISEDELLEDELLAPWYGPAVFARLGPNASPGAGVSTPKGSRMKQQQQQQPSPGGGSGGSSSSGSRRRRPRSSSGDDIDADSDDDGAMLTSVPRQAGQRRRSGQQQQLQWWDVFCGGEGRLLQRCIGQCNVQTDIKEAVFLGQDDALVACGSDDGYVFIYNALTGAPVKVLAADEDVANCVQPHPHLPVLATSGIDTVVRLWAPTGVADMGSCERYVTENQARMRDGARPLRAGMVPPHILQAALGDNPQLLQMLLQQLYRPTTPAVGGAAAAAGGGAAAGARGGPASEGTPEAGRQGLGPVPGIEIVGLGPEEDDADESDEESEGEGFGVDADGSEGLEGPGEEGGVGRARRRRPPRRQVQEVTCRMS